MKIALVSYINSLPFLYGLKKFVPLKDKIEIKLAYPSKCSEMFNSGEADVALLPVGALPETENYEIISDYCIGADGEVRTVTLFSYVSLPNIRKIILDFQSKTSVRLLKILSHDYWKINPVFIKGHKEYEFSIFEDKARLVIGDRVFYYEDKYPFAYDLSAEWKKYTGLPFVFAVWTAREQVSEEFGTLFNQALKLGLSDFKAVYENFKEEIDASLPATLSIFDYYTQFIDYDLNLEKKAAINLFLEKIKRLKI